MKKILTSALVVGVTALGFSQELRWGVKGGINFANLRGDKTITEYDSDGSSSVTPGSNKGKVGFHIGAFVEYPINEKLTFQPELLISTQGAEFENNYYEENRAYSSKATSNKVSKVNLTYLEVPIMFKYNVVEKLNVEFGPQIGFLIGAKNNMVYTDTTIDTSTNGVSRDVFSLSLKGTKGGTVSDGDEDIYYKKMKSVDLGLNFGASYDITENIFVQARYNLGLTNVNVLDMSYLDGTRTKRGNVKNSVFQISVGYKF